MNDETVPVWIEEPVFTVEADETSAPGEYPITVTAVAESYELTFVAGVLTVTESTGATGIQQVTNGSAANDKVYTLDGRRANGNTKGVYIKNGKKVIMK